jgi:glycosyltransferase involved in cell wall biosynthesis
MRVVMLVLNDMTSDARVSREAASLGAAGHDVTVLALRSADTEDTETRDGYHVRRVADQSTARVADLARKFGQQRGRDEALRSMAVKLRPDVVHAHDTNTLRAGAMAAGQLGAALVYDAHELYPDSLQQQSFQRAWPVQEWWRGVERRLVPRANAVLTVCDGLRNVLRERYGVEATVVANAPELRSVADRGLLRRALGVDDARPIVLYQGGLYRGRALEPLVEAMVLVDGARLVVQGDGGQRVSMEAHVKKRGIGDRVHFMGQVTQSELFSYTCGADIGTCFLDGVTLNHRLAWPNRLFMYFMAGIPSVVTDLPGMASLVDGHDVGLKTAPGDVASMASALSRLVADAELRAAMGARARRLAEERFNWGRESAKLVAVYGRIERERPTDA